MRKPYSLILILLTFTLVFSSCSSVKVPESKIPEKQLNEEQYKTIQEGIVLHDQGFYKEALAKYNEVYIQNPHNGFVLHEMSLTYFTMKELDSCEKYCDLGLQLMTPHRRTFLMQKASILDDRGQREDALELYDIGIKENPEDFMMHFNKGITLRRLNRIKEAEESFIQSINNNPLYPSAHYHLADMYGMKGWEISSSLASLNLLLLEPQGQRADYAFSIIDHVLLKLSNVDDSQEDIKIKLNMNEEDFSMVSMMISLSGALEKGNLRIEEKEGELTEKEKEDLKDALQKKNMSINEKIQMRLEKIIDMFQFDDKKKSFPANFYTRFLKDLHAAGHLEAFTNMILSGRGMDDVQVWISRNGDAINEFIEWLKTYEFYKYDVKMLEEIYKEK